MWRMLWVMERAVARVRVLWPVPITNDPVKQSATKHIARRDLFIRELVERKVITMKYVATADNVADVLTKPLGRDMFVKHRTTLLGQPGA